MTNRWTGEHLSSRLDRECSVRRLTEDLSVDVSAWASPGAAAARAAAGTVEPALLALLSQSERIGRERGRRLAMLWALPTLVLLLAATAVVVLALGPV